jgi:hypothetical protein
MDVEHLSKVAVPHWSEEVRFPAGIIPFDSTVFKSIA